MRSINRFISGSFIITVLIIIFSCTEDGMESINAFGLSDETKEEKTCNRKETAWADGDRYANPGNWATYTTYEGVDQTATLYAAENQDIGTVNFSSPSDNVLTITIVFDEEWSLQNTEESVKIQGYNSPPSGNPAPGLFSTFKGNELTVTVPVYDFYGIHVDVQEMKTCD